MKIGKLPPEVLQRLVLPRRGAARPEVVVGPALGEDAALIKLGDIYLAVHTDPISGSIKAIGSLAVYVPTNDIAVRGIPPSWLSIAIFLPPNSDEELLDYITAQIDKAASEIGVMVVGGHTEVTTAVTRPLVVATAMGTARRYVTTGGIKPGDVILMTKSAAQEAAYILAIDLPEEALRRGVDRGHVEKARSLLPHISLIREALALADIAHAMHDPTEGGIAAGLAEMAYASGVSIDVEAEAVTISPEVKALCDAFGINPLETLSSGVLLAALPEDKADEAKDRLRKLGIPHAIIGRAREQKGYLVNISGKLYKTPHVADKIFQLF